MMLVSNCCYFRLLVDLTTRFPLCRSLPEEKAPPSAKIAVVLGHRLNRWEASSAASAQASGFPPPPTAVWSATTQHLRPPRVHSQTAANVGYHCPESTTRYSAQEMALPYSRVDSYLRALARQAEGFGRFAIGGLHGAVYHVTSLADNGLGSLREACRRKEPLWIVFEVSGVIHLSSYLKVSSYKTIDGRGQRIKLTGKGLQLKECEHVIICNLEFEGGRDADCIQIKPKSRHIWIDRCSLRDYDDGLVDITRASTDITLSRCHFSQHNKTILIGADPTHIEDRCIRVTIHHCFFDGTRQRHPRVRFGKVHLYNNYIKNWGIYAVCASIESQIFSQCNIYEAGEKKQAFKYLTEKAADKEEAESGYIRSEGDLFVSDTESGLLENMDHCTFFKAGETYPTWTMEAPTEALKDVIRLGAGWQLVARPEEAAA